MAYHEVDPSNTEPGSASREHLAAIVPIRDDYATAPILEGFNWSECLARVASGRWYLVVFRSVRREQADGVLLIRADEAAYQEAMAESDGLMVYFRGLLDAERRCLSFCLWTDRDSARAAGVLPHHLAAVDLTESMYERFTLERHHLVKATDGTLSLQPADD